MEMGKLTAKLRDAVPVCLLVEGKEIKRYKNIEIPDELKKLEYKDFKFDAPLHGVITFKIMFEPDVLPKEFPQARERKMRQPLPQKTEREEAATVDVATEVKPQPQDEQMNEARPASMAAAFTQGLEDSQVANKPVANIAAMTDGKAIKAEIIDDGSEGRYLSIAAVTESTESTVQSTDGVPAKKPALKGKCKKGVASMEDEDK